jgi:hypothetical protein
MMTNDNIAGEPAVNREGRVKLRTVLRNHDRAGYWSCVTGL